MNNINELIKNAHSVSAVITYNRLWGIDESTRYDEILPRLDVPDLDTLTKKLFVTMDWVIGLDYHDLPDIAPVLYDCTETVGNLTAHDYLTMHVIGILYEDMANEVMLEVEDFKFNPETKTLTIQYDLANSVEKTIIPLGGFMETLKLFHA